MVSFVNIVGLLYIVARDEPKRYPIWIVYVQGAVFFSTYLFVLLNELRIRRRTREDAAWCERPGGLEEFAVEVSVQANRA